MDEPLTGPGAEEPNEAPGFRPPSSPTRVSRWRREGSPSGEHSLAEDVLAEETPVALCYNGVSHLVMMATPTDLEDFALGFSLSEGILQHPGELYDLEIRPHGEGIEIDLTIAAQRAMALSQHKRNLTGRTGCGLCGIESLQQAVRPISRVPDGPAISDASVQRALTQLRSRQPLQEITGAMHGAAWCNPDGDIQRLREDVGRHNALDKLIGALVRDEVDRRKGFLLMSSRASYEIVQKAAAAGITTLVAVSAPTAMAIRQARDAGIRVIGFARPGRHVRYC